MEAVENLKQAGTDTKIEEIVTDKGYHARRDLGIGQRI